MATATCTQPAASPTASPAADTAAAEASALRRPFGALATAAAALRPACGAEAAPDPGNGPVLAEAAVTVAATLGDELGRLLAAAAGTLDTEDRHRAPVPVGGTTTRALCLARVHGGSIAVSDARHMELGLALRRRLARAGATTGADFDGDRLRVQPTEAADNP